uniref:Uncharacterized protein n=1 Tax=Anguilla anguilla TaxID=7936 RepID=A0A0E9XF72_ANGAN
MRCIAILAKEHERSCDRGPSGPYRP